MIGAHGVVARARGHVSALARGDVLITRHARPAPPHRVGVHRGAGGGSIGERGAIHACVGFGGRVPDTILVVGAVDARVSDLYGVGGARGAPGAVLAHDGSHGAGLALESPHLGGSDRVRGGGRAMLALAARVHLVLLEVPVVLDFGVGGDPDALPFVERVFVGEGVDRGVDLIRSASGTRDARAQAGHGGVVPDVVSEVAVVALVVERVACGVRGVRDLLVFRTAVYARGEQGVIGVDDERGEIFVVEIHHALLLEGVDPVGRSGYVVGEGFAHGDRLLRDEGVVQVGVGVRFAIHVLHLRGFQEDDRFVAADLGVLHHDVGSGVVEALPKVDLYGRGVA